jgi:aminoglycoside phosphotransferase (APT) family kinase protein
MALALARIHDIEPDGFTWRYAPYNDARRLAVPPWARHPDLWARALEIVRGPRPQAPGRFIHRDYHPTNILFEGERLSGVVDWPNACVGPAGEDLGHCRLNLACLFGVNAADRFLTHYERAAGPAFCYHPIWDLLAITDWWYPEPPEVYPGWPAHGVGGLTDALIALRLESYLASVLARVRA